MDRVFSPERFVIKSRILLISLVAGLAVSAPAFADFSPGPNPITGTTGAQSLSSGTGTVAAGGTISAGSAVGVTMTGTSTLVNNGTIITTSGRTIDSNSGTANLTVTNAGLIQSTSSDAFRVNTAGSSVSLTNSGTIRVTAGGQAIDWAAIATGANTLTNQATGVITTVGEDAIRPGQNGVIYNYGTIGATPTGATDPSGSDGIDLRTQKTVTVTNSGTIYGRHGIATDGANVGPSSLTVANNAGGLIYALNGSGINVDGVNTSVVASVTNAFGATIRGGVTATATNGDGDGIDVDGVLTLTNYGDVLGLGSRGVGNNAEAVAAGGGTINNMATGRIIGSSLLADAPNGDATHAGNGILIDDSNGGNAIAATSIANSGLIQGKSGTGITIIGTFADTITNNSGGIIRGTGPTAVIRTGGGDDVVRNSGTIQHDQSGVAIDLEAGNDTLHYTGGAIQGAIKGGSGANTLHLGNVTHAYGVDNFQTIAVDTGKWGLISGVVSGSTLRKTGAGVLILAGDNTFAGPTTVSEGTLRIDTQAGSASGVGPILVESHATLSGSGRMAGSLTIDGVLAPGQTSGPMATLTAGADVTWNGSPDNAWQFQLGAGGLSDRLNADGSFLKGAGGSFLFDFLGSAEIGSFVLIDWAVGSSFAAEDFSYINLGQDLTGSFSINGTQLEFAVAAIPEPGTVAALLGLAVLTVTGVRNRRRPALSSAMDR